MKEYIVANSVRCNLCGDNIFSSHRHDFVSCRCNNISVDGGQEYLRRVGNIGEYVDTSIVMYFDDMVFIVNTLKDMRKLAAISGDTSAIVVCVLGSLMNTGYMTVSTGHDLVGQFLTYHGERASNAVVWALDTGRTNAGIVNAVIRAVRDAGFFRHKKA